MSLYVSNSAVRANNGLNMEEIQGHRHPGSKKAGKRKAKGKSKSALKKYPDRKSDEGTSSNKPTKETLEASNEDIFYDATEMMGLESLGYRDTDTAPSVGTESSAPMEDPNKTESDEIDSRNIEIEQPLVDGTRSKAYFSKQNSRSTRQSIGVQTVLDGDDETRVWRGASSQSSSDDLSPNDVFEDARETLTDYEIAAEQEKVKRGNGKNQQPIACPKDACRKKGFRKGEVNRTHPPQMSTGQKTSCCGCLLTVLFWLGVMLFVLFLLTLFFVIFLLFSRNHGMGIGPAFIYSDVELIRSSVNPSLDLRYHGPPPT